MFQPPPEPATPLPFTLDGRPAEGRAGDTVASALLALGQRAFRETAVSRSPRGPWCMMGACFDCLVSIDGTANRQACLTPLTAGMAVSTLRGGRPVPP